jgi:MFS family permease
MRTWEGPRVLVLHALGSACMGSMQAILVILPFVARQRFGATNWQTTVLTAAVPVTQFFTIFWNHVYARVRLRTYFAILALTACAPIALIGQARNVWQLMAFFVLAALGGAGNSSAMSPVNADLLRVCYQERVRGKAFGIITAAMFAGATITGQVVGVWSDHNADAYRYYFPIIAMLLATALVLYGLICRGAAFRQRTRPVLGDSNSWWTPLADMRRILREDRRFAGYEAAFMSYGIGWMICSALVPALATDRLKLNYSWYAQSTVVAFQLTNLIMLAPMGFVVDRIGPVRLATVSFMWLTIYPVGLIFAPSGGWLLAFSVLYAIGMVGVYLTWTLGPVSLAGDPSKAAHYLAIHGTLVGVRGIVAQGLGMALYSVTGSFVFPMLIAAGGFLWAAWRMRKLAGTRLTSNEPIEPR